MLVARGEPAEALEFEEEALDEIALAGEDMVAGRCGDVLLGGMTGAAPWPARVSRNAFESSPLSARTAAVGRSSIKASAWV